MKIMLLPVFMVGSLMAGVGPSGNPIHTATAGAYFTRLRGDHAIGFNPANLGYAGERTVSGKAVLADSAWTEQEATVSVTLAGGSLEAGNNAVYPSWINDQLYGSVDLRLPGKKDNFLSVFPTGNWNLRLAAEFHGLSFSIGNLAVALLQPRIVSHMIVPADLIDVVFRGVRLDEPHDLSAFQWDVLKTAPLSVAYGKRLPIPPGLRWIENLYVGGGLNLLLGLEDYHLVTDRMDIISTLDSIHVEGMTRTITNGYPDGAASGEMGTGFSIDLGVTIDINARLSASLAFTDLLAGVNWPEQYTTVNQFAFSLNIADIENIASDYNEQLDSLMENFDEADSTFMSGPGRTPLPAALILGATYRLRPGLTLDLAYYQSFGDSYFPRVPPQASLGIEIVPKPSIPLYAGIGLGGSGGFKWGAGFSLRGERLQWNLGFDQSGGLFNRAKGATLSSEIRLVF